MDWQSEPKKTLDSSNSEKEDKIFEHHRITFVKEYPNNVIKSVQYPDVRFSCQFCGSLDVMVCMDEFSNHSVIKCLDCGKNELEDKFIKLEAVKVCLY